MLELVREATPVVYNAAAVKLLCFHWREAGQICFRMHWHERMELILVQEGSMLIDFGPVQEEVTAGTLALISPNQPHKGICCQAPLTCQVMMFDIRSFYNQTDAASLYLTRIYDGKSKFVHTTRDQAILACTERITSQPAEGIGALQMEADIYLLFYLLYKCCLQEIQPISPFDQTIHAVLEYIKDHYASDLSTKTLSAEFQYAEPYFCRKFKESTGLSVTQYLTIFRIETAYHMLKSGNRSINEIAAACGFADANYFTRCFKKHFGHAPSYYKVRKTLPHING